jgi:hypothetical protein
MEHVRCMNGQQPKIFFENMPNLKHLDVVNLVIDLVSLKKLSWLEDLRINVLSVKQCNDEQELIRIFENFSKLKII